MTNLCDSFLFVSLRPDGSFSSVSRRESGQKSLPSFSRWSVLAVFLWLWLMFEVVRLVLIPVLFISFQAPFKTNLRAFYRSISRALFKKRSRAFQDQFKSMFRSISRVVLRDTQKHVNTNTNVVYKHFPSLFKILSRLFQNKFKSIA
jgi:hypothetical protein